MKNNNTRYICEGALIAVLYIVLTYISALFNLSSGVIQLRLSVALCILPMFTPAAIPGLAIHRKHHNRYYIRLYSYINRCNFYTSASQTHNCRAAISHSVKYDNYSDNIKICISRRRCILVYDNNCFCR